MESINPILFVVGYLFFIPIGVLVGFCVLRFLEWLFCIN